MEQFLQAAVLDQLRDSTWQLAFVVGGFLLLGFLGQALPSRKTFLLLSVPILLYLLSLIASWLSILAALCTPLLILILMVDAFLLSVPPKRVELRRSLNRKLSIGQECRVVLSVVNHGALPLHCEVRDSIPAGLLAGQGPETLAAMTLSAMIPPYAMETVGYALTPRQRGEYEFQRVHLRYRSRFGLLWLRGRGGRPETVSVVPDLRSMRRIRIKASRALNAGDLHKRALGAEGTQFSGLRHYVEGDDIRKMAWQATAKQDLPVIRAYEPEVEQPVMVLIDAGRRMAVGSDGLQKYDWALNAALSLMAVAVDRGDAVGVGLFSNRVLTSIVPAAGAGHLNRILETLGASRTQPTEPLYETVMPQFARGLRRRSLVVLFTDLNDPVSASNLLAGLKCFSRQHVLMVVTLSDAGLQRAADSLPETAYDAYRKGAALDLLAQRRQVQTVLVKSHRAIVIDAPPHALNEVLVNRYLSLKRKSLA